MMDKCEFCHEIIFDTPRIDGRVDDIVHRICSDCWEVINKKFKIAGWTEEEVERLAQLLESWTEEVKWQTGN